MLELMPTTSIAPLVSFLMPTATQRQRNSSGPPSEAQAPQDAADRRRPYADLGRDLLGPVALPPQNLDGGTRGGSR